MLAYRPTAERPISGAVLATISKISAVMVSARGRPMGSALRVATVLAHRGQRAFAPGRQLRELLQQVAIRTGDGFHTRILVLAKSRRLVYWTLVQYGRAVSRRFSLAFPSTVLSQGLLCASALDQCRGTRVEGRVSRGRFLVTRHSSLSRYRLRELTRYTRHCCPGNRHDSRLRHN